MLRQIRFQALDPQKIDALIDLIDHDLGYRLYQSIERTKCSLSDEAQCDFHFGEAAVEIDQPVSRTHFESWIDPELDQIRRCIDRLLTTCNVAPEDVDAIFMTGGSSFVPAIRKLFENKFGNETPIRAGQEFTSVAEGLAIYALELAG